MNLGLELLNSDSCGNKPQDEVVFSKYIDRMFDYYTNIIEIHEAVQEYGYSHESIIESIGNAIKTFFSWLREMFRRFISFIGQFFVAIPQLIGIFKGLAKLDKKVVTTLDLDELEDATEKYAHFVGNEIRYGSDPFADVDKFIKEFDEQIDNKVVNKDPTEHQFAQVLGRLSELSMVTSMARAKIADTTKVIEDLERQTSTYESHMQQDTEESRANLSKFNAFVTTKLTSLAIAKSVIDNLIGTDEDPASIQSIMRSIRTKIQFLNKLIAAFVHCGKKVGGIIAALLIATGKESCKVCVTASIPDFLLKHLREHYKSPDFKLTTVFFTNDIVVEGGALGIPGMPPGIDLSDALGGVTFGNSNLTNKQEQSVYSVHVTYGMVKTLGGRLFSGSFKQSTAFLTILVHEARHAWQMQTNAHFDGYNTDKGYEGSDEERDANKHMYRFVPTAEEQRWADGIIAQYDRELKAAQANAQKIAAKR